MIAIRLAIVLVAVAAGVSVANRFLRPARGRARAPNVLLIVMDTTRADRCSFQGYGRPTTPRIAEYAKDAVTFTDAWAPCCWTAPSHASLFTGLSPRRHGLQDGIRLFLDEGQTTLAERFRDSGWRTASFSNNVVVSPEFGLTQGFDLMSPDYSNPARPYPWAGDTHRRALDWVLASDDEPFFLFINDLEPHLPYDPPADVAARFIQGSPTAAAIADARGFGFPGSVGFNLGVTDDPRAVLSREKLALLSDLYDAEIATLDAEIGRLLDGLKSAGVLDDTIVVIASDHGENIGEHRRIGHLFSLHRNVLHVPLIVRFPGKFDGGRTVPDVVRLEDVAPTLLELCGIATTDRFDGASLLRDLAGRTARAEFGDQTPHIAEARQAFPNADLSLLHTTIQSVYDGRWHYTKDSTGREELYDLASDPREERNLAPAGGAELERLRKLAAQ